MNIITKDLGSSCDLLICFLRYIDTAKELLLADKVKVTLTELPITLHSLISGTVAYSDQVYV